MLINEDYLREFVEKNLWQLDKADLQSLANSFKEISNVAQEVNGITKEDIVGKPTISELKDTLDRILTGKAIITYNADFDRRMLRQSGYDNKKMAFTCLINLYTEYEDEERWISLQNALITEKIKINQTHRALDDCFACLELIKALANKR